MKDQKNDSTPVLARFGRDKRVRTVKATAEQFPSMQTFRLT